MKYLNIIIIFMIVSSSSLLPQVKAAFTRTYKEGHMTHYATDSVSKKSRTASVAGMEDLQEDSPDVEPESDSELSQDYGESES